MDHTATRRIVESMGITDDPERLVEVTLYDDGTFDLHTEDGVGAAALELDLDEIAALHRLLGHLLYVVQDVTFPPA